MEKHVDEWDLSSYPEQDLLEKHAGSDFYRFIVLDNNGQVDWKRVPTYKKVEKEVDGELVEVKVRNGDRLVERKRWDVVGTGKRGSKDPKLVAVWGIQAEDIRSAEEMIGGIPTMVQMGLYYTPVFDEEGNILKWEGTGDRRIQRQPLALLNVSEYYFAKNGWREMAYKDRTDPYRNQKRPVTKFMRDEEEMKELKKRLAVAEADKARLIEEKNKSMMGK